MTIGVVMNPIAGGGRMAAVWPAMGAALQDRLGRFDLMRTSRTGDATAMAQRFAEDGKTLVIAAGGDGTAGEVADGILRARRDVQIGLLPVGTGRDFARSLGLTRGGNGVDAIASGRTRALDAGRISYLDDSGRPAERHFVNIASFGLSGPTDRAVNRLKQKGHASGKLIFLYHAVTQLLRYRPLDVRVVLDGSETIEARVAVVAVANGRFFGGGMKIAPDARIDDGFFDVVIIRADNKLRLIRDLPLLYTGRHVGLDIVTIRRARRVEVLPVGEAALLDVDGESPGRLPASVEILPGALTLRG